MQHPLLLYSFNNFNQVNNQGKPHSQHYKTYKPHLLAALLTLRAITAPQSTGEQPSGDIVVKDGVKLNTNFIDDAIFKILSNYTILPSDLFAKVAKRSDRPSPPKTVTAEVASIIKSPGGGKDGLFYHGDSRPPAVVFAKGFSPQGSNQDLQNHLSFVSNSGLVSVTQSPQTAERYAFSRSADGATKGHIYVINAKDLPDGY
ncbi:hypothetical protein BM221_010201 [Beauveria bassiana]|uniref:Uncharacterized protein n=1 Tax=Beauveria bassiana TaxID=176275 RepID=A0A2N6N9T2_BEABA|nr:hypothetical protein BM221_010201 [Beauveria bassiana]